MSNLTKANVMHEASAGFDGGAFGRIIPYPDNLVAEGPKAAINTPPWHQSTAT